LGLQQKLGLQQLNWVCSNFIQFEAKTEEVMHTLILGLKIPRKKKDLLPVKPPIQPKHSSFAWIPDAKGG
jgi:hypothetical protein